MPTYQEVMEGEPKQRKKRDEREFRFQCALARKLPLLVQPGVYWNALPYGEDRRDATASRLAAMGVKAGPADLFFLKNGQPFMLELKVYPNTQSDIQARFQADWEAAGGVYCLAYTMEEALSFLEAWRLIKPDVSRVAA